MITGRLIVNQPTGAEVIPLEEDAVGIGRDPDNRISLEHQDVSRRHCTLEPLLGGGHRVVDLGSTNGVVVNGRRVTDSILHPFDKLSLGDVSLVYLDTATDAKKVLSLFSPLGSAQTDVFDRKRMQGPERDRLMWVLLMIQELKREEEVRSLLSTILAELLAETGMSQALLFLEHVASGRQELVAERNLTERPDVDGLAQESWVRLALEGERVTWGTGGLSRSTLCVPILSPRWETSERRTGRPVAGVKGALLLAAEQPADLTPEDTALLRAIGRQLGIVFSNARLTREATTDPLTRLATRRSQERALREELKQADAAGTPLGVILLDIDDFKHVNDTYGHSAGDQVLRGIGELLLDQLRTDDGAGRWGGEEFLVVLPGTDLAGATGTARKLVRAVAAMELTNLPPVTISAGVAVFPWHARESGELVKRADHALYAAKEAGKNRCEAYHAELEGASEAVFDGAQTSLISPTPTRSMRRETPQAWLHSDLRPPFPLFPGTVSLGRGATCDFVLPHPAVSRRHGRLVIGKGGIEYEDEGSVNGSRIGDEVVSGAVRIEPGAELEIGPFRLCLRLDAIQEDETVIMDALDTSSAPHGT